MKKFTYLSLFISLLIASCSGGNNSTPKHSHSLVTTENVLVSASCDSDGLKEIITSCSECEETIETHTEVIPAIGHDLYLVNGVEPSCDEGGYHDYYLCHNCDYSTYEYIPPKGHHFSESSYTRQNEIEPTCFSTGSYDVYATCDDCHRAFFIKTEYVSPLEHRLVHHNQSDPTCQSEGYLSYDECSVCHYKEIIYLSREHHHEGEEHISVIEEATCTTGGLINISTYCQDCGQMVRFLYYPTAPLGHDLVHHEHLDPTCTDPGHHQYESCSRCNYSTYMEIARLEHHLLEPSIKECHFDEDDPYVVYEYPCLYCEENVASETVRPANDIANLEHYSYCLYPHTSIDLGLNNEYEFSSLNPEIAGISSEGILKTFSEGETIIYINKANNKEDKTFIIVNVSSHSINFNLSKSSVYAEQNLSIENVVLNSSYSLEDVIFASDNLEIARVNEDLSITTFSSGTVKIHAFINHTDIHTYHELEVKENEIIVNGSPTCYLTRSINLKNFVSTTLPGDTLFFESRDDTIGSVNYSGTFTGNKVGTVVVDITSLKCGSATITVTVAPRPTVSLNSTNYSSYISISLSWSNNFYTCVVASRYEVATTINLTVYCGYDDWGSHCSISFTLNNTNSQTGSQLFAPASGTSASLYKTVSISGSVYIA